MTGAEILPATCIVAGHAVILLTLLRTLPHYAYWRRAQRLHFDTPHIQDAVEHAEAALLRDATALSILDYGAVTLGSLLVLAAHCAALAG